MRTPLCLWSLLFLATILSPGPARAGDLILSGGLNFAAPTELKAGTDQRWTGTAATAFGLTLDLPLSDVPFSFESGVFLKSSRSERSPDPGATQSTVGAWTDIPLIVHYHLDPAVSLGLGGYWSFLRSGDAVSSDESPDSGLLLNLRARFRIAEPVSFTLDARYLHGLSNLASQPGNTYNSRSVQALVGILYPLF
jgi:hypothetical protein